MNIDKRIEEQKMFLKLSGRLDTTTAPDLDSAIKEQIADINELEMDFTDLDYISSAGLRVLLSAQKEMSKKGGMKLTGVQDTVMEVFEVTGFADILTIE